MGERERKERGQRETDRQKETKRERDGERKRERKRTGCEHFEASRLVTLKRERGKRWVAPLKAATESSMQQDSFSVSV